MSIYLGPNFLLLILPSVSSIFNIYNNKIIKTEQLTIPHPEIQNRKFALIPLLEISSTLIHPVLGQNMTDLLENCTDILDVKKFSGTK